MRVLHVNKLSTNVHVHKGNTDSVLCLRYKQELIVYISIYCMHSYRTVTFINAFHNDLNYYLNVYILNNIEYHSSCIYFINI